MAMLAKRYNIPRETIKHWKTNIDNLYDKGGRPNLIDGKSLENITEVISTKEAARTPLNKYETTMLIEKEVSATALRKGKIKTVVPERTKRRIKANLGIRKNKTQMMTPARAEACSDLRMVYSTWIMLKNCIDGLPNYNIWNWDATQFAVHQSNADNEAYRVSVVDKKKKNSGGKVPFTSIEESEGGIYVKWMFMGSAYGKAVPLVLLVALDELGVDDFAVYEVPGLSYSTDAGAKGYLCCCKTRAGNGRFFNWFITNIAYEACRTARSVYGSVEEESSSLSSQVGCFISCDGESIVLDEIFVEPLRKLLEDSSIAIGKLAASTSSITQPADVSSLFKASKAHLFNLLKNPVRISDAVVEKGAIKALEQLDKEKKVNVPMEMKRKIGKSCSAVTIAIQETITPKMIFHGFERTGQSPLKMDKLISACFKDVSAKDMEMMTLTTENDVKKFNEKGFLSEEDMDESSISRYENPSSAIPRDQRQLNHQRAVLLTHPETLKREINWKSKGLDLGNIVLTGTLTREEKKQQAKDIKIVKRAETKRKKEQDRNAEKERKKNLSPEEKKMEKMKALEDNQKKAEKRKVQLENDEVALEQAKKRLKLNH